MTDIRSCRCGAFRWAPGYDFVGVRTEHEPFSGSRAVVFNAPCPHCLTDSAGREYTPEDMQEMGRQFRAACGESEA